MYPDLYRKVQETTGNKKMPEQLTINFEAVNHKQWDSCREYMDDRVIPDYLAEKGILKKYLAADLGLSPSELRRKLCPAPGDTRNFTLDDLEKWLQVTHNLRPVFYLLEKHAIDRADEISILKKRLAELEAQEVRRGPLGVA